MSSDQMKNTPQGFFSSRAELQPTQPQTTYSTFPGGHQYGAAPSRVSTALTVSSENKMEEKVKDEDYEPGSLPTEHLNVRVHAHVFHDSCRPGKLHSRY